MAFEVSKLINLFSAKSACTKLLAPSSAAKSSRKKKKPKTLHSWILAVNLKYYEFIIISIFLFLQKSKKRTHILYLIYEVSNFKDVICDVLKVKLLTVSLRIFPILCSTWEEHLFLFVCVHMHISNVWAGEKMKRIVT